MVQSIARSGPIGLYATILLGVVQYWLIQWHYYWRETSVFDLTQHNKNPLSSSIASLILSNAGVDTAVFRPHNGDPEIAVRQTQELVSRGR